MDCVCGCPDGDHEYPGGACNNCWHCQFVEYPGAGPSRGERLVEGEAEFAARNPRRWW